MPRISPEDPGLDLPGLLELVALRALRLQELPQLGGERKHPALIVLRRVRVEPDFPGGEVDLSPLEGPSLRSCASRSDT